MSLVFLTNTHDPNDKRAEMHVDYRPLQETRREAWLRHLEWLKDKVVGEPQATKHYTVEQLKEMKLVGIYMYQAEQSETKSEE